MVRIQWQRSSILLLAALTVQSTVSLGRTTTLLDLLPQVTAQSVPPNTIDVNSSNYVTVGNSNASQFGQLLWEQQDSIQQEILGGLNGLGPRFRLFAHSMDDEKFQMTSGVDISARREIYPINLGLVGKDGNPVGDPLYPDQVPRSGWLVVDSLRTGLTAGVGSQALVQDFLKTTNENLTGGYGFEAGQIIRKISIVNSNEEYVRLSKEKDDQLKKEMNSMNASTNPIKEGFKGYALAGAEKVAGWILEGLTYAYGGLGSFVKMGAQYFETKGLADLFYRGLADPYKLKQELFFTNAERVLSYLEPGDVLSMLNFKTYGPGAGGDIGTFRFTFARTTFSDSEIRITRLTASQCGLKTGAVCNQVLVSFITYLGIGLTDEFDGNIHLLHLKPWWSHATHTHFYQTEEQYKYNLDNPQAVIAFNRAVNPNDPSIEETLAAAQKSRDSGVRKQFYAVIGDAKEMAPRSDKPDNLAKTAVEDITETKLQAGIVINDHITDTDYYKKCEVDYSDVGLPMSPPQCTYDGLSQKTIIKLNFINLSFLIPFKFMKPVTTPLLDHRKHSVEVKEFGTFANLNAEVDDKGGNFHFRYTVSDKFPKNNSYFNGDLRVVKTMLGLLQPEMAGFYNSSPEGQALRDKIMIDLSNRKRNLEQKVQGLVADIYMNQAFTNEIFKTDPKHIQDLIAEMVVKDGFTWAQLEKLDGEKFCTFNKKYDGMIIGPLGSVDSTRDDAYINCGDLRLVAHRMWKSFTEIADSPAEKRFQLLTVYNQRHQRKPFIPLLMLLAGRNYDAHVKNGDLGIQFYYEAEDLLDTNDIALCKKDPANPNDPTNQFCKLQGFKPYLGQDSSPAPGTLRIVNLSVVGDRKSLATPNPKLVINFFSDLGMTTPDAVNPNGKTFRVSGFINEYHAILDNEPKMKFSVDSLVPQEEITNKGHKQFRYTLVLSDLIAKGLLWNKDYVVTFSLEDPTEPVGTDDFMHVSEMVEVKFRLPQKK